MRKKYLGALLSGVMTCAQGQPVCAPPADFSPLPAAIPAAKFHLDARLPLQIAHFWATWCPPCRQELPLWRLVAKSLPVTLFPLDDDPAPVRALLHAEKMADLPQRDPHAIWPKLQARGLPVTVLLVAGAARYQHQGALKPSTQHALIYYGVCLFFRSFHHVDRFSPRFAAARLAPNRICHARP